MRELIRDIFIIVMGNGIGNVNQKFLACCTYFDHNPARCGRQDFLTRFQTVVQKIAKNYTKIIIIYLNIYAGTDKEKALPVLNSLQVENGVKVIHKNALPGIRTKKLLCPSL